MTKNRISVPTLLVGACLLGLSGCSAAGIAIGAGATAGVAIAQERSVGDAVDDVSIRIRLNAALLEYDPGLFKDVSTESVEGRVLLTGAVIDPADKVTASRIAWNVTGVREVINEMQANDTSGILDFASDVWISSQLRAKMIADADVYAINYTIETLNGHVYLLGVAQSGDELKRATEHARTIRGVRKVISHVLLKGDPRRPIVPKSS